MAGPPPPPPGPPPPPPPPPQTPLNGDPGAVLFTRRWRSGVKALTLVLCAYTGAACALADWDARFGEAHVFSGVRPAARAYLSRLLGPGEAPAGRGGGGGCSSNGGGNGGGGQLPHQSQALAAAAEK